MSIESKIKEIETVVQSNPVVLYMKGTKEQPMCGFSAQVVSILNELNTPFIGFNVLEDDELRQAIKVYADWPTIPQLYVHGEFVGGCDITTEMYQTGELKTLLNTPPA